jgi:hypothetical protein
MLNRFSKSLVIAIGVLTLSSPISLAKPGCHKGQQQGGGGGGSYNSTSYVGSDTLKAVLVDMAKLDPAKRAAFEEQADKIQSDKPCRTRLQEGWCAVLGADQAQRVYQRLSQQFGDAVQLKDARKGGR